MPKLTTIFLCTAILVLIMTVTDASKIRTRTLGMLAAHSKVGYYDLCDVSSIGCNYDAYLIPNNAAACKHLNNLAQDKIFLCKELIHGQIKMSLCCAYMNEDYKQ